jgi:hypothetical protein
MFGDLDYSAYQQAAQARQARHQEELREYAAKHGLTLNPPGFRPPRLHTAPLAEAERASRAEHEQIAQERLSAGKPLDLSSMLPLTEAQKRALINGEKPT